MMKSASANRLENMKSKSGNESTNQLNENKERTEKIKYFLKAFISTLDQEERNELLGILLYDDHERTRAFDLTNADLFSQLESFKWNLSSWKLSLLQPDKFNENDSN